MLAVPDNARKNKNLNIFVTKLKHQLLSRGFSMPCVALNTQLFNYLGTNDTK